MEALKGKYVEKDNFNRYGPPLPPQHEEDEENIYQEIYEQDEGDIDVGQREDEELGEAARVVIPRLALPAQNCDVYAYAYTPTDNGMYYPPHPCQQRYQQHHHHHQQQQYQESPLHQEPPQHRPPPPPHQHHQQQQQQQIHSNTRLQSQEEHGFSRGYSYSKMPTTSSITPANNTATTAASDPHHKRHYEAARCPIAAAPNNCNIRCENCTYALLDFKRQLMQQMNTDSCSKIAKCHSLPARIAESLSISENLRRAYCHGDRCDVCKVHITQLKQEAFVIVRSIQCSREYVHSPASQTRTSQTLPASPPSYQRPPRGPNSHYVSPHQSTQNMKGPQTQDYYIEQKSRIWASNHKKFTNKHSTGAPCLDRTQTYNNESDPTPGQLSGHSFNEHRGNCHQNVHSVATLPSSPYSNPPTRCATVNAATSPMAQTSSASSFFARAAQKLNISSKKKKKIHIDPELPTFPTSFSEIIRLNPPPAPPYLLRNAGKMQSPGIGKVKVMVRIFSTPSTNSSGGGSSSNNSTSGGDHTSLVLSVDDRKKQITLQDPTASGCMSMATQRRTGFVAPKTFAFDAVFPPDDSLTEICATTLTDVIQGVVNGADGCIFSFGYSRAGKSHTMLGKDQSPQTLGIIPCALAWLFRLIDEHRDTTGARFSVRVSAVEVSGKKECLKDLLADIAQVGTETGVSTAPGVYLREDPICGTQLENQSELRAPTADQAAYYLDAAIAARSTAGEEELRQSHLLFTLHVYQYRVEKANKAGLPGVAGGRSRLHFINLGSCSKSKDPNNISLSLSALGNVILALLNGQRHIPHRDAKIARLLRDSLGNVSCRTCMIAHVSSATAHYNETLQVIQLASRIHRLRRRKLKFSSTSSDDSSTDESRRFRRPLRGFRMGTLREDHLLYSSSLSDPDCTTTSGSEQSCDTVIYLGTNSNKYYGGSSHGLSLSDNEGPPKSLPLLPRTNPRLPRRPSGSRSSGDEGSGSTSDSGMGRKFSPQTMVEPGTGVRLSTSVSKLYPNRRGDPPSPSQQSRRIPIPVTGMSAMSPGVAAISGSVTPGSSLEGSNSGISPSPAALATPSTGHHQINMKQKMMSSKMFKTESSSSGSSSNVGGGGGGGGGVGSGVNNNRHHHHHHHHHHVNNESVPPASGTKFHEQWIDGPGAAIYPDNKKSAELWVDGPRAFMVKTKTNNGGGGGGVGGGGVSSRKQQQQQQPHRAPKEAEDPLRGRSWAAKRWNGGITDGDSQTQTTLRNGAMTNEEVDSEHWIDGPSSICADTFDPRSCSDVSRQAKHSENRKKYPCPSQTNPPPSISHRRSPDRTVNAAPLIQQQGASNCQGSGEGSTRPESTASVDSTNAEPPDSRPASFHSNVNSTEEDGSGSIEVMANSTDKPIEDGLENLLTSLAVRRGDGPYPNTPRSGQTIRENNLGLSFTVESPSQGLASLESLPQSYKPQPQTSIKTSLPLDANNDNMQPPSISSPASTSSLSSTRRLGGSSSEPAMGSEAHTKKRVADWLKSVSTEDKQGKHDFKAGNLSPNSGINLKFGAMKHGQVIGSDNLDCIDAKALGKEIDRVWFTDSNSEQKFEAFYSCGDGETAANEDNPAETEIDRDADADFTNLLISNRESIYEIQADQLLELARKTNNGDGPDDDDGDTFSTVSFPKEDAESLAITQEEERVCTVQKLKALNPNANLKEKSLNTAGYNTQQPQQQPLMMRDMRRTHHCHHHHHQQYDGSKLSDLEEVSEEESVVSVECNHLCSQNGNGGSEPEFCAPGLGFHAGPSSASNLCLGLLSREIFHEEAGAFDMSIIKQNYTINPVPISSSSPSSNQLESSESIHHSNKNNKQMVQKSAYYSSTLPFDDDEDDDGEGDDLHQNQPRFKNPKDPLFNPRNSPTRSSSITTPTKNSNNNNNSQVKGGGGRGGGKIPKSSRFINQLMNPTSPSKSIPGSPPGPSSGPGAGAKSIPSSPQSPTPSPGQQSNHHRSRLPIFSSSTFCQLTAKLRKKTPQTNNQNRIEENNSGGGGGDSTDSGNDGTRDDRGTSTKTGSFVSRVNRYGGAVEGPATTRGDNEEGDEEHRNFGFSISNNTKMKSPGIGTRTGSATNIGTGIRVSRCEVRGVDPLAGDGIGLGGNRDEVLLSPYATVTEPKAVRQRAGSGHRCSCSSVCCCSCSSDYSGSNVSMEVRPARDSTKIDKMHGKGSNKSNSHSGGGSGGGEREGGDMGGGGCGGGTSSGYESMLRDSEATGTSSSSSSSAHEDSAGEECCSTELKKGTRRKKSSGSRRSRSAPARSCSATGSPHPHCGLKTEANSHQHHHHHHHHHHHGHHGHGHQTTSALGSSPSSKAWVDIRNIQKLKVEPMEIRNYDCEDVERMQKRRRKEEFEIYEQHHERVTELLNRQEELKQELTSANGHLMIEQTPWTFDCKSLLCFTCQRARKRTEV
ncbi:kinesin-like protein KIF26B [Argonauta hians]